MTPKAAVEATSIANPLCWRRGLFAKVSGAKATSEGETIIKCERAALTLSFRRNFRKKLSVDFVKLLTSTGETTTST